MKPATNRGAVTIRDVAQAVGVAKSTASYALSGSGRVSPETREAVLAAARRLGFEANLQAQQLSQGRSSRTVGIYMIDLSPGAGMLKVLRIQKLLAQAGYEAPLYLHGSISWGDELGHAELMRSLRRQKPLAIVCAAANLDLLALAELERYQDEGGTVVCYDVPVNLDSDRVIFDREDNTYRATRHLVELGHRNIGFFVGGPDMPRDKGRFAGFARALAEAGATPNEAWIWNQGLYEEAGARMAESFLSLRHRPTAMCIVNDAVAATFVAQVRGAGVKVPEDLSVVGHDDLDIAKYTVPLTTAQHPIDAISQGVVDLLTSRLDGDYHGPAREINLTGDLILRSSTAPI